MTRATHQGAPAHGHAVLPLLLGLGGLLGLASSCRTVEFYELEAFSDRTMTMDSGASEVHFLQKIFYSMEGSAGGIGSTAGGGCGCY